MGWVYVCGSQINHKTAETIKFSCVGVQKYTIVLQRTPVSYNIHDGKRSHIFLYGNIVVTKNLNQTNNKQIRRQSIERILLVTEYLFLQNSLFIVFLRYMLLVLLLQKWHQQWHVMIMHDNPIPPILLHYLTATYIQVEQ
jgi:hypothetical protein